jgi:hypothetical protein
MHNSNLNQILSGVVDDARKPSHNQSAACYAQPLLDPKRDWLVFVGQLSFGIVTNGGVANSRAS